MNHYLGVMYDSEKIEEVIIPEAKEFCPIQNGSLWQFAVFKIKVLSIFSKHECSNEIHVLSHY